MLATDEIMHYTALGNGTRHFEVVNDQNAIVGSLEYKVWLPNRARITTLNNLEFDAVPFGFWQNSMAVMRDGVTYAELKRTMSMSMEVQLANRQFTVKRKNFWQGSYKLENETGEEMAEISGSFKWRKFSFDYDIDTYISTGDPLADELLPMLLVYCMRALNAQHSGVF